MRYKLLIRTTEEVIETEAEDIADFAAILPALRANADLRASTWISGEVYDNGAAVGQMTYNGTMI